MAEVKIRSPRFRYDGEVIIQAAVCNMPDHIDCNVGNSLFRQHPYLSDIVTVRQDVKTRHEATSADNRQNSASATIIDTDRDAQSDRATSSGEVQIITRLVARNDAKQQDQAVGGGDQAICADNPPPGEAATLERGTLTELGKIDVRDNDGGPADAANNMPETHVDTGNEFKRAQRHDPSLRSMWTRADAGNSDFLVIDQLLWKRAPDNSGGCDNLLLVVPTEYRLELVRIAHDLPSSGHQGGRKTEQRLRALYYWPKMQRMVRQYVRACKECQMVAPKRTIERQPLEPIQAMHSYPFSDISVDIMGGQLPKSSRGNKYVMLIICNVSKWTHCFPLRNLKTDTIADRLLEFFSLYGISKVVRCDNFAGFKSELMAKLREKLRLQFQCTVPFSESRWGRTCKFNSRKNVEEIYSSKSKKIGILSSTFSCLHFVKHHILQRGSVPQSLCLGTKSGDCWMWHESRLLTATQTKNS